MEPVILSYFTYFANCPVVFKPYLYHIISNEGEISFKGRFISQTKSTIS